MEIAVVAFDPRRGARACTPAEDQLERMQRIPLESHLALQLVAEVMGWRPEQIAAARQFKPMRCIGQP